MHKKIAILEAVEVRLEHDEVHEQSKSKRKEVKALLRAIREWLAELGK